MSRTTRTAAPVALEPPQAPLDTSAVLAQVAELEAEVVQLREQNEKDAAIMGQMLARVADREQESKEARAEAERAELRASIAEARIAQLEGELVAQQQQQGAEDDPFGRDEPPTRGEAQDVRVAELEAALEHARSTGTSAAARAAALEAQIADLDANVRETDHDRSTATEVAAELAEKVETLESRVEAAEMMASAATEAKARADARAEAFAERIGELESELAVRDGKIDAADSLAIEATDRAVLAETRATKLEQQATAAVADALRLGASLDDLKGAFVAAEKAVAAAEEKDWARSEELVSARRELGEATERAKGLEAELAEQRKEIVNRQADHVADEASLKKRHEESLGQHKAMFERQLAAVEAQLAETKASREKTDALLKDLRVRAQELEAEQASLEERLAIALDDRDTVSRHVETMKEEIGQASSQALEARRETARAREMLTRAALSLEQLDGVERDTTALRAIAIREARAALSASVSPSAATAVTVPEEAGHRAVVPPPPSSLPPAPVPAPAPTEAAFTSEAVPAPERPAPESIRADFYETVNESEVSFASVAPPASIQLRAVAPFARTGPRPSGRPTPARPEAAAPASVPPPHPLSDPEIRISIDEDED